MGCGENWPGRDAFGDAEAGGGRSMQVHLDLLGLILFRDVEPSALSKRPRETSAGRLSGRRSTRSALVDDLASRTLGPRRALATGVKGNGNIPKTNTSR